MRKIIILLLGLAVFTPVLALAQDGVFKSYSDMRAKLDPLMMHRNVSEVLVLFGGSDEMTVQELAQLDRKVRSIYLRDFKKVAQVRRKDLLNGWRQEMLAYWTGSDYIYAYILLHDRGKDLLAINFKFNSNFHELMKNF